MAWRVWGDPWLTTASMETPEQFQTATIGRDIILRAVRTWIIVIGDPVFDSLNMKIYSNEVVGGKNTPRKMLHTSTDVRTKSEIHTEPHAIKEIYFTFDDVPLAGDDKYNFVINADGYDPTPSSYLAWRKAFPDPVYAAGYVPAIETISLAPYALYFIGGDF